MLLSIIRQTVFGTNRHAFFHTSLWHSNVARCLKKPDTAQVCLGKKVKTGISKWYCNSQSEIENLRLKKFSRLPLLALSKSYNCAILRGFSSSLIWSARNEPRTSNKAFYKNDINSSSHLLTFAQQDAVLFHPIRESGRYNRNNEPNKNNNFSNFPFTKFRFKFRDRTRQHFKGRVARIKANIATQNEKLADTLETQKKKGEQAIKRMRKKLEVKKENIKTIPNLLTTIRMASAPALAYLVVHDQFGIACCLFVAAGITDLLDGYIARNFKNQRTALGTALDPLADKLLVSFLTVSLTSANLIPVPVTAIILGRDAGLILATFYIRYISLAPPRTISRYFDVSHVTAKLYPSNISKLNTVLQLSYVAFTLASPVFDFIGHPLLQVLMYTTTATTIMSGTDYLLTWRKRLKIIKNK